MKKLILIAIAFVGLQTFAQDNMRGDRKQRAERMQNLSAEDMASMQTKKMTLALDLTAAQQEEVKTLFLEEAKVNKEKIKAYKEMKEKMDAVKPTKEERQKMKMARMDRKIEMKAKMKSILNETQYTKWEAQLEKRDGRKHHKKGTKKP